MQTKPVITVLVALAITQSASASDAPTIEEAHKAYYQEEFGRSLAQYEVLAAAGNGEAAERAGFMLLQGSGLFGPHVVRDTPRAQVLLQQAAMAGRPGAAFLLHMLVRTD